MTKIKEKGNVFMAKYNSKTRNQYVDIGTWNYVDMLQADNARNVKHLPITAS